MDSNAATMTQDTENLVDPPKVIRLRGASMRKWIGISQAGTALLLVGLGITFLFMRPPFSPGGVRSFDDNVLGLRIIGNCAVGIWGGVVFIITGTFGIFSGKTKNMVSLYLALCLASLLIAMIGVGSSGGAVALNFLSKNDAFYRCQVQVQGDMNYDYTTVHCCISPSHYNCRDRYSSYGDSYELPMECEQIQEQHEVCLQKVIRDAQSRMPLIAIMVAAFALECFFSILGASFTCIGLCDCKKKQDTQEESLVYVQLNPHVQMVRSTGASGEIRPGNLVSNGSQVPRVMMMLNTAAQPVQLTNHSVVNSSQKPMQFIPTDQVSQMVNASGQMSPSGQVMLVNTSGRVTPHMLSEMGNTQSTSPPSYTVSS